MKAKQPGMSVKPAVSGAESCQPLRGRLETDTAPSLAEVVVPDPHTPEMRAAREEARRLLEQLQGCQKGRPPRIGEPGFGKWQGEQELLKRATYPPLVPASGQ